MHQFHTGTPLLTHADCIDLINLKQHSQDHDSESDVDSASVTRNANSWAGRQGHEGKVLAEACVAGNASPFPISVEVLPKAGQSQAAQMLETW